MRARIIGILLISLCLVGGTSRAADSPIPPGVDSDELLKLMRKSKSLSVPDPRRDANAFRAEITLHGKKESFRETEKALLHLRHRSAASAENKADPNFKALLTVNGHKHEYKTVQDAETALRVVEAAQKTARKSGISIREMGDFLNPTGQPQAAAGGADPVEEAIRERVVESIRAETADRGGRAPGTSRVKQIIDRETKAARASGALPNSRDLKLDPQRMLALAAEPPAAASQPAATSPLATSSPKTTRRGEKVGRTRGQKVGTSRLKNRGSQPTETPFGEPSTGELSPENVEDLSKTLEGALGQ